VLGERIKFPVVVQQVIAALDASGSNHCVDGLTNGHAGIAKQSEILRRLIAISCPPNSTGVSEVIRMLAVKQAIEYLILAHAFP
jgi:hypothetical protein